MLQWLIPRMSEINMVQITSKVHCMQRYCTYSKGQGWTLWEEIAISYLEVSESTALIYYYSYNKNTSLKFSLLHRYASFSPKKSRSHASAQSSHSI